MAHQADGVAFGVPEERHALGGSGRAQPVVGVGENQLRLGDDLHSLGPQSLDRRLQVVDLEVEQGARRAVLQQQPDRPGLEEKQPGRVEESRGLRSEQRL